MHLDRGFKLQAQATQNSSNTTSDLTMTKFASKVLRVTTATKALTVTNVIDVNHNDGSIGIDAVSGYDGGGCDCPGSSNGVGINGQVIDG